MSAIDELRSVVSNGATSLPAGIIGRARAQQWALTVSAREIRKTWAHQYVRESSVSLTPLGYRSESGALAWYLFESNESARSFDDAQETLAFPISGDRVFALALGSGVTEMTVDPRGNAFVLTADHLRQLAEAQTSATRRQT